MTCVFVRVQRKKKWLTLDLAELDYLELDKYLRSQARKFSTDLIWALINRRTHK